MFVEHGLHAKGEKSTVQFENSHKTKFKIKSKVLFRKTARKKQGYNHFTCLFIKRLAQGCYGILCPAWFNERKY